MNNYHVMVVDDDTYTIELYRMIIAWTPFRNYLRTEVNPVTALEVLEGLYHHPEGGFPDYVLLDLSMPEMHGYDFIREFEDRFPSMKNRTRFIITTSSVIREEEEKAAEFDSIREFLVKPIPRDYIESLITGQQQNPGDGQR